MFQIEELSPITKNAKGENSNLRTSKSSIKGQQRRLKRGLTIDMQKDYRYTKEFL